MAFGSGHAHQSSLRTATDQGNCTWTWRESPRLCHKEKPLDVALHVDPLGPTLLREGAQVGSAVSPRFAAGRSREGGWSGCLTLPFRLACQSDGLRPGAGKGAHRTGARDTSVSRARELRPPSRCERATTTRGMRQPSIGEAHGSIGRPPSGNAGWTQRTSQWTKALRSSDPARSSGSSRPACGNVPAGATPANNGEREQAAVSPTG